MANKYVGNSKDILKYLGFLIDDYHLSFKFQSFGEYLGFVGPINTYSFFNESGCFTLLEVVQRNEWGWYISKKYSCNLYELLELEIQQRDYIKKSSFSYKRQLKALADVLQKELKLSKKIFGIVVID